MKKCYTTKSIFYEQQHSICFRFVEVYFNWVLFVTFSRYIRLYWGLACFVSFGVFIEIVLQGYFIFSWDRFHLFYYVYVPMLLTLFLIYQGYMFNKISYDFTIILSLFKYILRQLYCFRQGTLAHFVLPKIKFIHDSQYVYP